MGTGGAGLEVSGAAAQTCPGGPAEPGAAPCSAGAGGAAAAMSGTTSPEAVKKLLENMQGDLRGLSLECRKKFPPVKEVRSGPRGLGSVARGTWLSWETRRRSGCCGRRSRSAAAPLTRTRLFRARPARGALRVRCERFGPGGEGRGSPRAWSAAAPVLSSCGIFLFLKVTPEKDDCHGNRLAPIDSVCAFSVLHTLFFASYISSPVSFHSLVSVCLFC